MRFIDRKEELARLERLAKAGRGGFAALWGRRRIGKTEILKEWCRGSGGVYTVADQSSASVQREAFALTLSERFPGFADVVYPSWKSLFAALTRRAAAAGQGSVLMSSFLAWLKRKCLWVGSENCRRISSRRWKRIIHWASASQKRLPTQLLFSCRQMRGGLSGRRLYAMAGTV